MLRLPRGEHDPLALTGSSVPWFPVAGALVGVLAGLLGWGVGTVGHPLLAAASIIAAELALTGLLHFDGLVDSADGLLSSGDPQRRLEVMADPRAGSFGIGVSLTVLLIRFAALSSLSPTWRLVPLLAATAAAGRCLMVFLLATMPSAKQEGMAYFLAPAARQAKALSSSIGAASLSVLLLLVACRGLGAEVALERVISSLAAFTVASVGAVLFSRAKIGGITGDVVGATALVAETALLAVFSLAW